MACQPSVSTQHSVLHCFFRLLSPPHRSPWMLCSLLAKPCRFHLQITSQTVHSSLFPLPPFQTSHCHPSPVTASCTCPHYNPFSPWQPRPSFQDINQSLSLPGLNSLTASHCIKENLPTPRYSLGDPRDQLLPGLKLYTHMLMLYEATRTGVLSKASPACPGLHKYYFFCFFLSNAIPRWSLFSA